MRIFIQSPQCVCECVYGDKCFVCFCVHAPARIAGIGRHECDVTCGGPHRFVQPGVEPLPDDGLLLVVRWTMTTAATVWR